MGRYLARRLLQTIFVLFFVCTFVFVMLHLVGDPARLLVSPESTKVNIEDLRRALGLDKPLIVQYVDFMLGVLRLDFGSSFKSGQPAAQIVLSHLPETLELTFCSLLLSVPLGILLGSISALRPYSLFDNVAAFLAVFSRAIPSFWLGIMLILFFSIRLQWLPPSGSGSLQQMVMPTLALGTSMAAVVSRLTRSSMLEVLSSDYVPTARAKGLREKAVVLRHVLPNTLLPVVTVVGLQMGNLLGGSIVIETVFAWPGIGWLLTDSIAVFDFPVVQATVFMIASFFVVINLLVDILYVFIDPRIRLT